jgi:hypothetical protein
MGSICLWQIACAAGRPLTALSNKLVMEGQGNPALLPSGERILVFLPRRGEFTRLLSQSKKRQ